MKNHENFGVSLKGIIESVKKISLKKRGIFSGDFYLSQTGLAAHFEKEWADLLLNSKNTHFEFVPFELKHLSQGDSVLVAKTLLEIIKKDSIKPESYLEIGPGLGRAFYEIVKETPSLHKGQLVEPSKHLATTLKNLFLVKSASVFPVIFGNEYLSEVSIDPVQVREPFQNFDLEIINGQFNEETNKLEMSDLVLCLNVIDQCKNPKELLDLVKAKTSPNGILAISCTYQWRKNFLGINKPPFKNLRSQFGEEWEVLKEEELPFSIRINERFWYTFLSQVLYLKRKG